MTKFFQSLIDSIPSIDPETGDRAVNLTLAFTAGFILAMLAYGG
jgi:hypothetical protein